MFIHKYMKDSRLLEGTKLYRMLNSDFSCLTHNDLDMLYKELAKTIEETGFFSTVYNRPEKHIKMYGLDSDFDNTNFSSLFSLDIIYKFNSIKYCINVCIPNSGYDRAESMIGTFRSIDRLLTDIFLKTPTCVTSIFDDCDINLEIDNTDTIIILRVLVNNTRKLSDVSLHSYLKAHVSIVDYIGLYIANFSNISENVKKCYSYVVNIAGEEFVTVNLDPEFNICSIKPLNNFSMDFLIDNKKKMKEAVCAVNKLVEHDICNKTIDERLCVYLSSVVSKIVNKPVTVTEFVDLVYPYDDLMLSAYINTQPEIFTQHMCHTNKETLLQKTVFSLIIQVLIHSYKISCGRHIYTYIDLSSIRTTFTGNYTINGIEFNSSINKYILKIQEIENEDTYDEDTKSMTAQCDKSSSNSITDLLSVCTNIEKLNKSLSYMSNIVKSTVILKGIKYNIFHESVNIMFENTGVIKAVTTDKCVIPITKELLSQLRVFM